MMIKGRNYNVKFTTAMRHSAPRHKPSRSARKGRAPTVGLGHAAHDILLVYNINRRQARTWLS
jgi:hypothetical protein